MTTSRPSATLRDPSLVSSTAALRLQERRRSATYRGAVDGDRRALAERRLQRWRRQAPLQDLEMWRQWLAVHLVPGAAADVDQGAAESRLLDLLATPDDGADLGAPSPPWKQGWQRVYGATSGASSRLQVPGLLGALRPLLEDALGRLDGAFGAQLEGWGENAAATVQWPRLRLGWMQQLTRRLKQRALPTLVLELRIAAVEERLDGPTPEARFENFVAQLADPEHSLELLSRYPVLMRQLWNDVERWLAASMECIDRLLRDFDALRAFLGSELGAAVAVKGSGGDLHRGGRSVLFIEFADGNRVVYKPRPLAVEVGFQTFLRWLSDDVPWVPRPVRYLDRQDYGWMEWLEPSPCRDTAQVTNFYRRQGVLLAALHLLGATDLHHENVLAEGEHPLVLDLETLCHPPLQDLGTSEHEVFGAFEDSVLRVGLLPQRLRYGRQGADGFDASGLGAEVGQSSPGEAWDLQGIGTDALRLVAVDGELRSTPGRPTLEGEPVDPSNYGRAVAQGFETARAVLARRRRELLEADGPLAALRGATTRVVARPTRIYGRLMQESMHPQLLGDAVDRDRHFDRLWLQVPGQPWLRHLVTSELDDLWDGDIPYFSARTDSHHLWDGRGRDLGALVPESGWQGVVRRLAELDDPSATVRQLALVRQSIELRAAEKGLRPRPRSGPFGDGVAAADGAAYLKAARGIARTLGERAFIDAKGARWWAPKRLDGGRWTLDEAGPDLYEGVAGIALFLARLAEVDGDAATDRLAAAAVDGLRRQLALPDDDLAALGLQTVGAYGGWGGVIYALMQLAQVMKTPQLLQLAEQCIPRLADALPNDRRYDVVDGAAGAVLVLCRLARRRPASGALHVARRCADHLLAHRVACDVGCGWPPPEGAAGPLAGLSHGAAGIAWALFTMAGELPENEGVPYLEAAQGALAYEATLFNRQAGNWRDVRRKPQGADDSQLYAWCHGAPGVAVARLASLDALVDAESCRGGSVLAELRQRLVDDARRAVDATWRHGFGLTHCLCHGDLGNLDVLMTAAARGVHPSGMSDEAWRARGAQILAGVEARGCLFGTPGGTEPPGLLVGMAGIGYQLLRLAAPDHVPSILSLASGGDGLDLSGARADGGAGSSN